MRDGVEWSKVEPLPMPVFLRRFSLHDSGLAGIALDAQHRLFVDIVFDLHWNRSVPAGHDALLMRFGRTYQVNWHEGSWPETTLSDAISSQFDDAARAALLDDPQFDLRAYQGRSDLVSHPADDESLTRTVFNVMNWGRLEVLHGADTRLVVFDAADSWIDVSTLAPSVPVGCPPISVPARVLVSPP